MERFNLAAVFLGSYTASYIIVRLIRRQYSNKAGHLGWPPVIARLPIVGSLPFLPDFKTWHINFQKKSEELGSVIGMYIGSQYTVILNSSQAVQDALVKHSQEFADRPVFYTNKNWFNINGKGVIDHSFDAEFRKQHKLILSILKDFGFGQGIMETRIQCEVSSLVQRIRDLNGKATWPDCLITSCVLNVILGIVKGCRENDDKVKEVVSVIHNFLQNSSEIFIIDLFPVAQFLPSVRKQLEEVRGWNGQLFEYISDVIDTSSDDSFVRYYIDRSGSDFQSEQLQFVIRDLLLAGTETSASTLLWSVYLLAGSERGRIVREKMRTEINSVVPRDRLPSLDDRARLPYVEATICEIMRIKTIVPLALPHETLCDTTVGGYFIPAHTIVFPNLYAVHMDPVVWQDPTEFRPERFLDITGKVVKKEKIMPFSLGRRSCLGELLARQEIFLFLTALVQNFIMLPPEGQDSIECDEKVGITLAPSPFDVRLIPSA